MVTPEVVGHIDPVRLVELKDERVMSMAVRLVAAP
jgi:hypothetical protein